jgi:hypothetical protein
MSDAAVQAGEDKNAATTSGLTVTQQFSAAAYTCGTFLTFLVPSETEPNLQASISYPDSSLTRI